jgi:hypothetical protein
MGGMTLVAAAMADNSVQAIAALAAWADRSGSVRWENLEPRHRENPEPLKLRREGSGLPS